jgi:hypothetical protein
MSEIQLTTRNAELSDLRDLLVDHRARRLDVVAPATAVSAVSGHLRVDGAVQHVSAEGVTSAAGLYRPTEMADDGIAQKLGIPLAYVRRTRAERPDLYDANVNGWLHGGAADTDGGEPAIYAPDKRSFLLRLLKGDDEGTGVCRAFLSDKYRVIDNLDILTAALAGVREAGVDVEIDGCDLSDRKMYVRVLAPQVAALAPELLKGYKNPFTGEPFDGGHLGTIEQARRVAATEGGNYEPGTEPVLFAGFVISNSELGGGAFSITPRLVVRICRNGLTIKADALKAVHLGAKMEQGVIRYSDDTQEKQLALVTAQARDAVATFLDVGYVKAKIAEMDKLAGVEVAEPAKVIHEVVAKSVIPNGMEDDVLNFFIKGGQTTAGGVMQAATAAAQGVTDADLASEIEGAALEILAHAARAAS